MEFLLLGLVLMALLKKDSKKNSKNSHRTDARRRAQKRQKYWEDAHWWHLNHGDG